MLFALVYRWASFLELDDLPGEPMAPLSRESRPDLHRTSSGR